MGPTPVWLVSLCEEVVCTQTHTGKSTWRHREEVAVYVPRRARPQGKPTLLTPWPWTSSLQDQQGANLCCEASRL